MGQTGATSIQSIKHWDVAFWLVRHKSIVRWFLRHGDDHEVQPVPRISEEGEPADTEASGHHFNEDLQRVDDREHDSVHRERKKNHKWKKINSWKAQNVQ